jgi:hypothetical protein
MRTGSLLVLVTLSLATPAAADTAPRSIAIVGGAAAWDPKPRSTFLVHEAPLGGSPMQLPSVAEHAPPTIIFMNRMGGTYVPGDNDSRTNRSSIPSRTSQVNPWNVSAAGWQEVMDCMTAQFSRFNVIITDVDPGNVPHIESVVAGYPQDVGMGSGVGGVSPFTDDCGVIPNSIVFTFAGVYGTAYRDICETAAQEVSHSFGLDHEYQCRDPMTYLTGCGDKSFQDNLERCGEYSARTCWCGGTTQNSVAMLRDRLGPHNVPPVVSITEPADGATVEPGFEVAATASDMVGALVKVELYVDGALVDTLTAAPWTFATDAALADGSHTVEVRATDDGDATATDQVAITVARGGGGGGGGGGGSGSGSDDGDGTGDGNDDGTIVGGCAAAGGTGGALVLIGLALLGQASGLRRRASGRKRRV